MKTIKKALFIIFLFILFYFYLSLFKNSLIDDAFITFCYVKSLLYDGTWGMYPGYITNTATSPLNVILLALVSIFTKSVIDSAIILTATYFVLIFLFLIEISKNLFYNSIYGYLCTSLIIFNPLLISTIGLESFLFITILVISIHTFLNKRWIMLSVMLALLTLTRADGFLVLVVYLFFVPTIKTKVNILLLFILVIMPWYLFSWIHIGSFFPETFMIKKWQVNWWGWGFFNGIFLYIYKTTFETIISIMLLPLIPVLFFIKDKKNVPFLLLGLFGVTHFVCYCLLKVPPYHWYYTTEIVVVILLGTFTLGIVWEKQKKSIIKLVLYTLMLVPAIYMFYIFSTQGFILREAPIHTNWATHEQFKNIGLRLKESHPKASILIKGEIGTFAFYSDDYLWDAFSDREIIRLNILKNINKGGLKGFLYKINFFFFPFEPKAKKYFYILSMFNDRNNATPRNATCWKLSSKWFPQSIIYFSKY